MSDDSGEVRPPSLRDEMRMNIHGVVKCLEGGVASKVNPEGRHYVWRKPDGEARWRKLQVLLEKLAGDHKIVDREELEDAVDAAAQIYHRRHRALPKGDVDRLLESISEVTKVLCEENDARIAGMLDDRDNNLIKGDAWKFNRAWANRSRLFRIRADLSELSCGLRRLPNTRKGDMQLLGAVADLKRRWKSLSGKKVGMPKFVESVIAFIDPNPDVATKLPSALRLRVKGVAKSQA